MESHNYSSLSVAMKALEDEGFAEQFKAYEDHIKGLNSENEYKPSELLVVQRFRFEGMTNPADQTELLGIKASDGTKGTLVMSYSAEGSQNREMVAQIPVAS
jgi:hypothetical protein